MTAIITDETLQVQVVRTVVIRMIYEEIEDGAEIIWNEYENITFKKVKSRVRSKDQLETFDDSDEEA